EHREAAVALDVEHVSLVAGGVTAALPGRQDVGRWQVPPEHLRYELGSCLPVGMPVHDSSKRAHQLGQLRSRIQFTIASDDVPRTHVAHLHVSLLSPLSIRAVDGTEFERQRRETPACIPPRPVRLPALRPYVAGEVVIFPRSRIRFRMPPERLQKSVASASRSFSRNASTMTDGRCRETQTEPAPASCAHTRTVRSQ